MAFTSDERQLLHDSLQDYFANSYTFEHFRELIGSPAAEDGFSRQNWSEYAELGWLGVALPESAGGSGGNMTELAIVLAAAGAALALEPFHATLVLGAAALTEAGSPAQREILKEVAAGRHVLAFCHYEPDSGYARDHVTTVAREQGDNFVLSGEKSFALSAHAADQLVVSARLDNGTGPIALFLVPTGTSGIDLIAAPALDGRRGAAVTLSNVSIPMTSKLDNAGADAGALIERLLDRGAIGVCAEAVGAMAAVTEQTMNYLKSREQFGQPLSKFQVLQHRLVDMSVAAEEARAVVHAALEAIDDNQPDARRMVWKAKAQTAKSSRFVGGQAIQLHGGMGMTDELAVGHYYKRLAMCETMFGDAPWYLKKLGEGA